MKKLETKIIKKIYSLETKKTAGYLLFRFLLVIFFLFLTFIFTTVTIDILNEQHSFDLLEFFRDDFEVVRKYFFGNLVDFYQELPQPLTHLLLTSIIVVLVIFFIIIKNLDKMKNKLFSIYKFYKSKAK